MNKTVAITGADGFIGTHLIKSFIAKGYAVNALVYDTPKEKLSGVKYYKYRLNEPFEENALGGADYVIHCAYLKHQPGNDSFKINFEGTKAILDICSRRKAQKLIFFSSLSSHEAAVSEYGRTKFAIESLLRSCDVIFKPGLVIGNGGLFKEISTVAKKNLAIPVVTGGSAVQIIDIDQLVGAIHIILEKDVSGTVVLATDPIPFKDLIKEISSSSQRHPLLVPVPYWIMYCLLLAVEKLRLPIKLSRENLLGMKNNKFFDCKSHFEQLGLPIPEWKAIIKKYSCS